MKDHYHKYQYAGAHDLFRIMGYHSCNNQADSDNGYAWKNLDHFLCRLSKHFVDDKTQGDRDDDNLDNRHKHADHIDCNCRSQKKIGDSRGKEGSQKCVDAGHSHRKGNITLREIRDHIAGSTSGAGSHQHYSRHQGRIQLEYLSQDPCQDRHNGKLCQAANDNILRTGKHQFKIV